MQVVYTFEWQHIINFLIFTTKIVDLLK